MSLQILTILSAKEKGMFSVTWAGWQLDGRRYWFLSVGFLYSVVLMLLPLTLQEVSRKGMELAGGQSQLCCLKCFELRSEVNFYPPMMAGAEVC